MSIIWAEGFDHYGTTPNGGRDMMLSGAWAQFSWGGGGNGTVEVSTDQKRTGDYSLFLRHTAFSSTMTVARRVIGAARLVIGVAYGIYIPSLPLVNKQCGLSILDASNNNIIGIMVQSDGAIGLYTGDPDGLSYTLIGSSDPVITAAAWGHIEVKAIIDNIVGEVEVRVNGVTVLHLTDLDLGTNYATQLRFGTFASTGSEGSFSYYLDDIIVWDDNGTSNNDFLGPARVTTTFPASDTAQADWTPNGASGGYECVDEVPPDGDTTYIVGSAVGDKSDFGIGTLPPETQEIMAVYIPALARLDDAGSGSLKVSMISDTDVASGSDIALTGSYTYWPSVFEVDPNTSSAWTKETLEAALVRVEKVD